MDKLPEDPDALKQLFDLSQAQYKDGSKEGPNFTEEEVYILLYIRLLHIPTLL